MERTVISRKGRLTAVILTVMLLGSSICYAATDQKAETPMTDAPSSWAAEEVNEAIEEGLVPEELQNNYQQPVTRAELAHMISYYMLWHKARGTTFDEMWAGLDKSHADCIGVSYKLYKENTFIDTNDHVLNRLAQFYYIRGFEDGSFRPSEPISRQDTATIMWRVFSDFLTSSYNTMKPEYEASLHFSDFDSIGSWAQTGVGMLWGFFIFKGVSDSEFAPHEMITREQSILMMLRMTKFEGTDYYKYKAADSMISDGPIYKLNVRDAVEITDLAAGTVSTSYDTDVIEKVYDSLKNLKYDFIGFMPDFSADSSQKPYTESGYKIRFNYSNNGNPYWANYFYMVSDNSGGSVYFGFPDDTYYNTEAYEVRIAADSTISYQQFAEIMKGLM